MFELVEIEKLLDESKNDLASIGKDLLAGKRQAVLSGLVGVVTTVALGNPFLGKLVALGAAPLLVEPANEILERQIASWKTEQDQQSLAARVEAAVRMVLTETIQTVVAKTDDSSSVRVEAIVNDAVLQLMRGQNDIAEKLNRLIAQAPPRETGGRIGTVESGASSDRLLVRYIVCHSFEAFHQIASGDLARAPFHATYLAPTEAGRFQTQLCSKYPTGFRALSRTGPTYASREDFAKAHPVHSVMPHSVPWKSRAEERIWVPTDEEFLQYIASVDYLTRDLARSGVPAAELARGMYTEIEYAGDECEGYAPGTTTRTTTYIVRTVWPVYVAATNIAAHPITLRAVVLRGEKNEDYRPLQSIHEISSQEAPLPPCPIRPNETVLIPIATLLAPFDSPRPVIERWIDQRQAAHGIVENPASDVDELVYAEYGPAAFQGFHAVGPRLEVSAIPYADRGFSLSHAVHDFDPCHLYTLDRDFMGGSCPHLFFVTNGSVVYWGELFQTAGQRSSVVITVPEGATLAVIAELEQEVTTIESVMQEGRSLAELQILRTNDYVNLPLHSKKDLLIVGQYDLENPSLVPTSAARKRQVIGRFVTRWVSESES